jgi:hypothetical protein
MMKCGTVSLSYELGGYFTNKFELDGHTDYTQLADACQRYTDVLTQRQANRKEKKIRRSIKRAIHTSLEIVCIRLQIMSKCLLYNMYVQANIRHHQQQQK